MKNLLKFLVIAPFALLFLIFAFANRQIVTVSFDPFVAGDIPAFAIAAPLFVILILAVMFGVLAGGAAVWLSQGRYRRAARQNRAEAERLRLEAQRLRAVGDSDGATGAAVARRA